jgi:cytochrome P450
MNSSQRNQLPPGPGSISPFGHLFSFRRDSLAFLKKLADEYGDIARFRMGPFPVVLLNHPDYIKEVLSVQSSNFVKGRPLEMAKEVLGEGLLTSEGDFHKRQSRIIQPAFHRKMIESYASAMTEYAIRLTDQWEDGETIDIFPAMIRMSTGIAAKAMFSVDVEQEAPEINEALEEVMTQFWKITLPFSEWLLKLPLPSTLRFRKAKARLDQTIHRIIDAGRSRKTEKNDLLSLLLEAQKDPGAGMTDQQVHDQALTLFLAAFDTTSLALSWAWYLLSQHPEAEAELHEELDSVLQGRRPRAEDVPQLEYTRKVFGEAMRLYPPIYLISRQALNDFSIGEYVVPAGTIVLVSPYIIHRDSRFYPDPDKFDPHTWESRTQGVDAKYTYIPFSRGPRSCIGESFAWMEGVLALAAIAQSWQLRLLPGHPVAFSQSLNLRPKYGMKMRVQGRK